MKLLPSPVILFGFLLAFGGAFFIVHDPKTRASLWDPCYRTIEHSEFREGSPVYERRGNRVCMQYEYEEPKRAGNHYFFWKTVKGADPATFREIAPEYFADKRAVYFRDLEMKGAGPETFQILGNRYAKDEDQIFWREKVLPADYTSFVVLPGPVWTARDRQAIYRDGEKIVVADPHTFEVLGSYYAKDQSHVYFTDSNVEIMEGADPVTFKLTEDRKGYADAQDKEHTYYFGKQVNDPDRSSTDLQ